MLKITALACLMLTNSFLFAQTSDEGKKSSLHFGASYTFSSDFRTLSSNDNDIYSSTNHIVETRNMIEYSGLSHSASLFVSGELSKRTHWVIGLAYEETSYRNHLVTDLVIDPRTGYSAGTSIPTTQRYGHAGLSLGLSFFSHKKRGFFIEPQVIPSFFLWHKSDEFVDGEVTAISTSDGYNPFQLIVAIRGGYQFPVKQFRVQVAPKFRYFLLSSSKDDTIKEHHYGAGLGVSLLF